MRKIVAITVIAILVAISLGAGVTQAQGSDSNISQIWYTSNATQLIERTGWGGEPRGSYPPSVQPRLYKRVGDVLFLVGPGTAWQFLTFEFVGENTWVCQSGLNFEKTYAWGLSKVIQVSPLTMTISNDEMRTTVNIDVYVLRETKPNSGVYNWEGFEHWYLRGTIPLGKPATPSNLEHLDFD